LTERTFTMIKPDAVERGLVDEVIDRIKGTGLKIVAMHRGKLDRAKAEELYSVHRGKDFFEKLVAHVLSGEVVVMLVEGDRAVVRMRELIGATDPTKAEKGTIRGDLATDITHNVIHAADSPESFEREAQIFFSEDQL
jgi:nucleoside-diphosphate kinase